MGKQYFPVTFKEHSLLTECAHCLSQFLAVAVINTMIKNNLGRKGTISGYSCSPSRKKVRSGTTGRNLEAGIEEAVEECLFTGLFTLLSYRAQDH